MSAAGQTVPDQIERVRTFAASPERVWQALTDPTELGQWFSDHAEVDLRPGGALFLHWETEGDAHGVIETVDPPHRFAFRWEPSGAGAVDADAVPWTLVEFTLEEVPEGTRLTVIESGFASLPESIRANSRTEHDSGWDMELDHLGVLLDG